MRKSNVYEKLENFFDETIINVAKKMGYREENIIILEDDEAKLRKEYPDIYDNLISCSHNRDSRNIIEYAQDLICSWIFEDYLIYNLNLFDINVELSGEDRERKILRSSSVSSKADYFLEYNGKKMYIELANDYRGYWKRKGICDLRDDKYKKLANKKSTFHYTYLLGIDFVDNEYFFIDIANENLNVKYSEFHYAFRKPAYSISLKGIKYNKFSFENIAKELKEILND